MQRTLPPMTDVVLDTTIHEPSLTAGELAVLAFAVERSRATFAWKVSGLDAEALRRPFPPSAMTLGGLIKHLAFAEDDKVSSFVTGEPLGAPWDRIPDGTPAWEW